VEQVSSGSGAVAGATLQAPDSARGAFGMKNVSWGTRPYSVQMNIVRRSAHGCGSKAGAARAEGSAPRAQTGFAQRSNNFKAQTCRDR